MQQLSLFDAPLSRVTDPTTSYLAAEQVIVTGTVGRHEQMVIDMVRRFPNRTAGELAETVGCQIDYVQILRRVKRLVDVQEIIVTGQRECQVRGNRMRTFSIRYGE